MDKTILNVVKNLRFYFLPCFLFQICQIIEVKDTGFTLIERRVFRHRGGAEKRFPGMPRAWRRETLVEKQIPRYFGNKGLTYVIIWKKKKDKRTHVDPKTVSTTTKIQSQSCFINAS